MTSRARQHSAHASEGGAAGSASDSRARVTKGGILVAVAMVALLLLYGVAQLQAHHTGFAIFVLILGGAIPAFLLFCLALVLIRQGATAAGAPTVASA